MVSDIPVHSSMLAAVPNELSRVVTHVSIVNRERRIVGIGYNGFPMGCSDDLLPWARKAESELDTKYPYVSISALGACPCGEAPVSRTAFGARAWIRISGLPCRNERNLEQE